MKKALARLVLAGALSGALCIGTAAAAYPTDIQYPQGEGEPVLRTYTVRTEADIAQLPREDFLLGGRTYQYQDFLCEDLSSSESKPFFETLTQDFDTKDMTAILAALDPYREVVTEEGYSGVLVLDPSAVSVSVSAYGSRQSEKSLIRTYPNLSDADLSYVPKTVDSGSVTYTLADISWTQGSPYNPYDTEIGTRYTATATYAATVRSSYAKGYTVTAKYYGTVEKTTQEGIRCTLVFFPVPEPPPAKNPWPAVFACLILLELAALIVVLLLLLRRRRREDPDSSGHTGDVTSNPAPKSIPTPRPEPSAVQSKPTAPTPPPRKKPSVRPSRKTPEHSSEDATLNTAINNNESEVSNETVSEADHEEGDPVSDDAPAGDAFFDYPSFSS